MQPNIYNVEIRVSIRPYQGGYGNNGGLDISEQMTVHARGFMETCAILGKFHELAESMKISQEEIERLTKR